MLAVKKNERDLAVTTRFVGKPEGGQQCIFDLF